MLKPLVDPEGFENRLDDKPTKVPKKMNFFRKFAELQLLMIQHNAGLTASHPYASTPINWPFSLAGISFWTENSTQKQIYLIGNLIGWWACVVGLSIYIGVLGADLIARRRGMDPIPDRKHHRPIVDCCMIAYVFDTAVRDRLWNNTGFFMLVWAVHFLPFFLFSRQLFIHHYLPSHLASALIAGSVLSFVLSDTINYPISLAGPKTRLRPKQYADVGTKGVVITALFAFVMFFMFSYIAPLTYGSPG